MEFALSSSKPSGAPGPDQITNKMLKLIPQNIKSRLEIIFNASLQLSYLPSSWKLSNIKMIHKKGKPKDQINSFRPISLISCISKWMEKIINTRILLWAEQQNILPPCQSGFRKNKSCHDHIARLDQIVTEGFNKKKRTGLITFDLEKAFDKASHQGIIFKLEKQNLPSALLNWTENFLSNRSFYVTWNKEKSSTNNIKTGVPQGSCLSPTLFNIFFSDIDTQIPANIHRALYADDLGILYSSKSLSEITKQLQKAVNAILAFCDSCGLKINKSKTTYLVFTTAGKRKNYERTYKLNLKIGTTSIPMDPAPVFLGIKLDPKLAYTNHLEHITSKIAERTRLLRKVKSLKLPNQTELCITIFNSQIRSILDYAFIPIISPTSKIANKLQTIQTRALKTIKYFPLKTSTKRIHEQLGIDLLSTRTLKNAKNFAKSRTNHPQIIADYSNFIASKTPSSESKYKTIFELIPSFF